MAWPVFSGIICYFSFCSDLHTNTHIYAHTHQHIVEGWSQWQSSLQDNRWTKGTRRGECQARMEAGWVEVGAKGNSWRGLMGDEKVVVVVAGGGVSLTLASVRWSDGMQRPPAVREEDEEQGRIKALTPLALFKPGVINDKTHRRTEHASWPLWARCYDSGPGSLVWSLSQHFWLMSDPFPTTNYGNNAERDEAHNPAAALHNSLIPQNKWDLSIRYSLKWRKTTFLLQQLFQVLLFLALLLRSNHFLLLRAATTNNIRHSHDIIQLFSGTFIFQKHFIQFQNCIGKLRFIGNHSKCWWCH